MGAGRRSSERALQKVLGKGANVNEDNPLEVHDPKLGSLASYEGTTTADGAGDGSDLIDSVLATKADYNGNLVVVTSGAYAGQGRDINGGTTGGTVTPSSAFGGQILSGTNFVIFALRLTPAEVAAIEAKLDHAEHGLAALHGDIGDKGAGVDIITRLGAFTAAQNLKAILGNLTTTKNLGGILGAFTTANNLKALLGALTTTDTLKAILGGYTAAAPLKAAIDAIAGYLDTEIDAIKAETDQLPNVQHETEWASAPTIEALANAAATALTAGVITPTYPTGATRVRAILMASIHVANKTAVAHHIKFKIEGKKGVGAYGDLLDLTAQEGLSLVEADGATDGWSGAIDVTALVDTSGEAYSFRFEVDSDNAGNVIYICSFVLALVYTM